MVPPLHEVRLTLLWIPARYFLVSGKNALSFGVIDVIKIMIIVIMIIIIAMIPIVIIVIIIMII